MIANSDHISRLDYERENDKRISLPIPDDIDEQTVSINICSENRTKSSILKYNNKNLI